MTLTNEQILAQWFQAGEPGEVVQLPSGKQYRLIPVDIIDLIDDEGSVPNFLRAMLESERSPQAAKQKAAEMQNQSFEQQVGMMKESLPFLNRLAKASIVVPRIVDDEEAFRRGEGILLSMIPMQDKYALITYAMGGEAALQAANRFLAGQPSAVGAVQTGGTVRAEPGADVGDTE